MNHNYYWITNSSTFLLTPLSIGVQVYPSLLYPSTPSCLGIRLMDWVVQGVFPLVSQWSWVHNSIPSHRCPQSYQLESQPPLLFTWFFFFFPHFFNFWTHFFASFTLPFLCPNSSQTVKNPLISFFLISSNSAIPVLEFGVSDVVTQAILALYGVTNMIISVWVALQDSILQNSPTATLSVLVTYHLPCIPSKANDSALAFIPLPSSSSEQPVSSLLCR